MNQEAAFDAPLASDFALFPPPGLNVFDSLLRMTAG